MSIIFLEKDCDVFLKVEAASNMEEFCLKTTADPSITTRTQIGYVFLKKKFRRSMYDEQNSGRVGASYAADALHCVEIGRHRVIKY